LPLPFYGVTVTFRPTNSVSFPLIPYSPFRSEGETLIRYRVFPFRFAFATYVLLGYECKSTSFSPLSHRFSRRFTRFFFLLSMFSWMPFSFGRAKKLLRALSNPQLFALLTRVTRTLFQNSLALVCSSLFAISPLTFQNAWTRVLPKFFRLRESLSVDRSPCFPLSLELQ